MTLATIEATNISVLKGNIKNLKHTFYVGGQSTSIGNMAIFEIDSQSIVLRGDRPLLLDIMDEVAVAGSKKQGVFYSSNYCNFTKKVYSPPPTNFSYIFSGVFFTSAVLVLIIFDITFSILFSLLFAYIAYHVYSEAVSCNTSYQLILDIVKNNPVFDHSN